MASGGGAMGGGDPTVARLGVPAPAASGLRRDWLARAVRPLRAVWWLFTNVRFAIVLLVILCLVSLAGVLVPQLPSNVRGDAFAEARWLDSREGSFGFLAGPMDRLGLFDMFHAPWFAALMAATVVSTGAYVLSRFPGVWLAVTRPRKRVPDRYFQMAPARLEVAATLDAGVLEGTLRRARYRVERFDEAGATYLFADRFQWAQLGTLLTHAAVVVFIVAAVVSRMDSYSAPLFLSEGSTLPVFPVRNPQQMQVELIDARGVFSADGQPLDYSSSLAVYQGGELVKRCVSTVNSPCSYNGYRFFQAGYFGFGAAVEVRDTSTGNVVYKETLALSDTLPSPHVVVSGADGRTLLDRSLVLADVLGTEDFVYYGTLVQLEGGRLLSIGAQQPAGGGEWRLVVLEPGGSDATRLLLREGESGSAGGLSIAYLDEGRAPAAFIPDLPLPPSAGGGGRPALLQLANVVYGTGTASEGTSVDTPATAGPATLTITGLRPQSVSLEPGDSLTIDGYEYRFAGQREFSGIQVKRDRSDYLIWAGAALIIAGMALTFWVPRRRLWAKITAGRTVLAGQAPAHAHYPGEMRRLVRAAGAPLTGGYEDDD